MMDLIDLDVSRSIVRSTEEPIFFLGQRMDEAEEEELSAVMQQQSTSALGRWSAVAGGLPEAVAIVSGRINLSPASAWPAILPEGVITAYVGASTNDSTYEALVTGWNFAQLTAKWQRETALLSSPTEIAKHEAYRAIIQMGKQVLPLILADLQFTRAQWFEALEAITGANPVDPHDRGNVQRMVDAWVDWGRQSGFCGKRYEHYASTIVSNFGFTELQNLQSIGSGIQLHSLGSGRE